MIHCPGCIDQLPNEYNSGGSKHCPGCVGTYYYDKPRDILDDCPGCGNEAEIARLTALVAVAREMADALDEWQEAKRNAVAGFSEREPGVMQNFMGAASALLAQSIALDKANLSLQKFRALEVGR